MLQPSLSLQIEFHTSNLFQMLLSVAACQFCLPLTQCLHKVFSPHSSSSSSGQAAVFSDSSSTSGHQPAPAREMLNKSWCHFFIIFLFSLISGTFFLFSFFRVVIIWFGVCLMVHFTSCARALLNLCFPLLVFPSSSLFSPVLVTRSTTAWHFFCSQE